MVHRTGVAAFSLAFVLALADCSSSSSSSPPSGSSSSGTSGGIAMVVPASSVIGAAGGSVASNDGALQLTIPAGALDRDVTITITPVAQPAPGSIGAVFEIGPTGTTFAVPVEMTIFLRGLILDGRSPEDLRVATIVGGAWKPLDGARLDLVSSTVSGKTTHLSPYGLVTVEAKQPVCGSGGVAAACPAGVSCTYPSCAAPGTSDPCASYPGSTPSGCTDTTGGYTTKCCFKPGDEVCVKTGAARGCPAGGSCPPPPTCGDDPCSGVAGSTTRSCTNHANGYDAVCCLPPGSALPTSSSGDGGTTPPSSSSEGGAPPPLPEPDAGAGG